MKLWGHYTNRLLFIQVSFLLVTASLFCVPGTIAVNLFPLQAYDTFLANVTWVKEELLKKNQHYDMVFLGDSRVELGLTSRNCKEMRCGQFAIGGSSPIEGYLTLARLVVNKSRPKKIYLAYSLYHYEENQVFWSRLVKTNTFSFVELVMPIVNSNFLGDSPWYDLRKNWLYDISKFILYRVNFLSFYRDEVWRAFTSENNFDLNSSLIKEKKSNLGWSEIKGVSVDGFIPEVSKTRKFKASKLINLYMLKLLDLALENNIEVILDTMPVRKTSYSRLKQMEYFSGYKLYLDSLKEKFPKMIIHNSIHNVQYEDDYFADPGHLSTKGVHRFSEEFLDEKYNIF